MPNHDNSSTHRGHASRASHINQYSYQRQQVKNKISDVLDPNDVYSTTAAEETDDEDEDIARENNRSHSHRDEFNTHAKNYNRTHHNHKNSSSSNDKETTSKRIFHKTAVNAIRLQQDNRIPLITTPTTTGESGVSSDEEQEKFAVNHTSKKDEKTRNASVDVTRKQGAQHLPRQRPTKVTTNARTTDYYPKGQHGRNVGIPPTKKEKKSAWESPHDSTTSSIHSRNKYDWPPTPTSESETEFFPGEDPKLNGLDSKRSEMKDEPDTDIIFWNGSKRQPARNKHDHARKVNDNSEQDTEEKIGTGLKNQSQRFQSPESRQQDDDSQNTTIDNDTSNSSMTNKTKEVAHVLGESPSVLQKMIQSMKNFFGMGKKKQQQEQLEQEGKSQAFNESIVQQKSVNDLISHHTKEQNANEFDINANLPRHLQTQTVYNVQRVEPKTRPQNKSKSGASRANVSPSTSITNQSKTPNSAAASSSSSSSGSSSEDKSKAKDKKGAAKKCCCRRRRQSYCSRPRRAPRRGIYILPTMINTRRCFPVHAACRKRLLCTETRPTTNCCRPSYCVRQRYRNPCCRYKSKIRCRTVTTSCEDNGRRNNTNCSFLGAAPRECCGDWPRPEFCAICGCTIDGYDPIHYIDVVPLTQWNEIVNRYKFRNKLTKGVGNNENCFGDPFVFRRRDCKDHVRQVEHEKAVTVTKKVKTGRSRTRSKPVQVQRARQRCFRCYNYAQNCCCCVKVKGKVNEESKDKKEVNEDKSKSEKQINAKAKCLAACTRSCKVNGAASASKSRSRSQSRTRARTICRTFLPIPPECRRKKSICEMMNDHDRFCEQNYCGQNYERDCVDLHFYHRRHHEDDERDELCGIAPRRTCCDHDPTYPRRLCPPTRRMLPIPTNECCVPLPPVCPRPKMLTTRCCSRPKKIRGCDEDRMEEIDRLCCERNLPFPKQTKPSCGARKCRHLPQNMTMMKCPCPPKPKCRSRPKCTWTCLPKSRYDCYDPCTRPKPKCTWFVGQPRQTIVPDDPCTPCPKPRYTCDDPCPRPCPPICPIICPPDPCKRAEPSTECYGYPITSNYACLPPPFNPFVYNCETKFDQPNLNAAVAVKRPANPEFLFSPSCIDDIAKQGDDDSSHRI